MFITVEDFDDNLVFKGEADDFLFQNDNDIELETILEKLEYKNFGDSILVKNNDERYIITKIDELI
jgi:hypothetical protein